MNILANILYSRAQLDEAEKMQLEALAMQIEIFGERDLVTISTMSSLAITLHSRGQLDEAEKMHREVLALQLDIPGGRNPITILSMK